jgi:hypothetical protein
MYRISAKNLGALALPDFCPRCFWLQAKMGFKLPFQIFPGIFSSIDSYSKTVTHLHRHHSGHLPAWMEQNGIVGDPVEGLHHSRFQSNETEHDILLTGVPDEIIRNGVELAILDYKTARHTEGQDALLPVYRVQLNCYARIAERLGMGTVRRLALLYYEPKTDITVGDLAGLLDDDGFAIRFNPQVVPIPLEPEIVPPLLEMARRLFDSPNPPQGLAGCTNCRMVERVKHLLQNQQ